MLVGRRDSFAIEYSTIEPDEPVHFPREYMPIFLKYWINNVAIGDMSIPCYVGDLVQDLAEIVRDNGARDGHELCLMNKSTQFMKIYEGIYDDLRLSTLDMPAKYNIRPDLPPFGEWFIFALKCANKSILIYSEFPFSKIERHEIYEHELNGVLRLTFNKMNDFLEGADLC